MKSSIEESIQVLKATYPVYSKFEKNEVEGVSYDREILLDSILILKCQLFVEYIRSSKLHEAILFAQSQLQPFYMKKEGESTQQVFRLIDRQKYLQVLSITFISTIAASDWFTCIHTL